jgi:hypothetical protein
VKKSYLNDNQILFPITLDDAIFTTRKAWAETIRTTRDISDFRKWQDPALYRIALENFIEHLHNSINKDFNSGKLNNYLKI